MESKPLYKLGDKIKIRSDLNVWDKDMNSFAGHIVTISEIIENDYYNVPYYHIKEDDGLYPWTDSMIDRLVENKNCFFDSLIQGD